MVPSESTIHVRAIPKSERLSKFGTCVHALAARKGYSAAKYLAEGLDYTDRGARLIIDGKRDVPARALVWLNSEILN